MRRILSLLVSGLTAGLEFWVLSGVLGLPEGTQYLKYLTVLSNLWLGIAETLYALSRFMNKVPTWVTRLKYIGVTLTTLTFVTVLLYIGPKTGFVSAYEDANLWLHLILPLLALFEYLILHREDILKPLDTLLPLLPIASYATFYIGNLIQNGYGGKHHPNDWYGFAETAPIGAYIAFAALLLVGWLIAVFLQTACIEIRFTDDQ